MINGVIIGDGAMGTMLQSVGMPEGIAPEKWNLDRPSVIRSIHDKYVEAGAQVIETNTFGGNRIKLRGASCEEVWQINHAGARLARDASCHGVLVAGSMGPTGGLLAPWGDLSFSDTVAAYREQAAALATGGVDFLLVETMMDLQEARAAFLGAATTGLPIGVQLTFQETGRTLMGTPAQVAAGIFRQLGAVWVGTNCGTGPLAMMDIVTSMQALQEDVSVFPNAGLPILKGDQEMYPMGPEEFALRARQLAEAGATLIGGCCGTTPQHIALLRSTLVDELFVGSLSDLLKVKADKASLRPSSSWIVGEKPLSQANGGVFLASRTRLFDLGQDGVSYRLQDVGSLADLSVGDLQGTPDEDGDTIPVALIRIPEASSAQEIVAAVTDLQMVATPVVFACDAVSNLKIALEHYCGRAGVLIPQDSRASDHVKVASTLGALAVYS